MKHIYIILSLLLSFTAMAQDLETVTVDGKSRTMLVYAPSDISTNAPLMISLHGAGQSAAYQRDQTHWNACADTAKIVVVYPNANGSYWDTGGTSDIVFLDWIIENMYSRYHIDRNRVYISGFSLGAMMTYQCIEKMGDRVAAFAPVSGVRFDNRAPISPRRVPIIHTHGTGDDVFKWVGDPNHMAGGYPYIPDYVESWATYEGLTEKEVISPYPASKPSSIATLTTWRSTDPDDDIEVALLQLEGKGHWHSEDLASGVSTTQEIWKFCKRYSLGPVEPEPPTVVTMEPEDNSFDLTDEYRTFTLTLSDLAVAADITAELSGAGQHLALTPQETENSATYTFIVPEGAELPDGYYKLRIQGIKNPEGGMSSSLTFSYTYGYTEVGDELSVDTYLQQSWADMEPELAEGIPYGWKRVNSNASGENDTRESGSASVSGARLKYFHAGGDFNAGFYLSAREYEKCDFTYGNYGDYPLTLPAGQFRLQFKSTYWSQGSFDGSATFNVAVSPASNPEATVLKETIIPTGCLQENVNASVENAASHDYAFEIEEAGDYMLNFNMSQGWSSVILAEPTITSYPSAADMYKGGFLRMMSRAQRAYDLTEGVDVASVYLARNRLKKYIDKYADLVSTAPSVYIKAMENLEKNLTVLEDYLDSTSSIGGVQKDDSVVSRQYYTVDGRPVTNPGKGLYILLTKKMSGEVEATKVYLR